MDLNKEQGAEQPVESGNIAAGEDPELVRSSEREISAACAGMNYMDCIGTVRTMGELCAKDYAETVLERYLTGVCTGVQQVLDRVSDPGYFKALCDEAEAHPALLQHECTKKFAESIKEQYDAAERRSRTYRGIEFASVEEAAAAAAEEPNMELLMRSTARDDPNSITMTIQRMSGFKTRLKEQYIDTLNEWLKECDLNSRTFHGTVYDTVEIRNAAEAEYRASRDYVRTVDRNNEQAVAMAYNSLLSCKYPSSNDIKEELLGILKQFDQQHRTVDGVVLSTRDEAETARAELQQIADLMPSADPNNEPALLEIKSRMEEMTTPVREKYLSYIVQLLNNYDINYRTFRGILCDTREEADLLRKEDAEITALWSTVRQDDEQSMFSAKAEAERFTTFLKGDFMIRIDQMLKDYDIAMRSFNGVLYPTREEAALNRAEFNEIGRIMSTVYPDNEQSMLDALMRINQMKTAYKNQVLDNLNQMWNAYDQNMRTYQGILFETRSQAENARQTREEFYRLASSMDLSQQGSLVALDNYIEDKLNPYIRQEAMAFVAGVRDVLNFANYIFAQNNYIDPSVDRKGSAELYHQAKDIIPRMEQYGINSNGMRMIMERHYNSLNPGQKLMEQLRK